MIEMGFFFSRFDCAIRLNHDEKGPGVPIMFNVLSTGQCRV